MDRISQNRLPNHLGAFVSLENVLAAAVTQRSTFIMSLCAYPVASHAVARLIALIKLTDMSSIYAGVLKARDLTLFAATILDSIPLARVDKSQLDRADISTYVKMNSSNHGIPTLSPEDIDLVAYLITSAESNEGAWLLEFTTTPEENPILQFQRLYQSLLSVEMSSKSKSDTGLYNSFDAATASVYDIERREILPLQNTRRVRKIMDDAHSRIASADVLSVERETISGNNALRAVFTTYNLASLRVLDHLLMLILDTNIWGSFVSPRLKVDPSLNLERSKSLKLAAAYFQSILIYPHIFNIELFYQTYQNTQSWMQIYPAMPADILENFEQIIRKHDFLDARNDVKLVFDTLEQSKNESTTSAITGLPIEVVGAFGLDSIKDNIDAATATTALPVALTELKTLDDEKYRYLLLSFPITEFHMGQTFSEHIFLGNLIGNELNSTMQSINPGLQRYYKEEIVNRLKTLDIRIPFGFSNQIPMTDEIVRPTTGALSNGRMLWRPLSPIHSLDYERYLRDEKKLSVFSSSHIMAQQPDYFSPRFLANLDVSLKLRNILKKPDWKTLVPSNVAYHDTKITTLMLQSSHDIVKDLLRDLTHMSYTLLERQMNAPYLKELFATFFSSFACLYSIPADEFTAPSKGAKQNDVVLDHTLYQIEGYGNPYGMSYASLSLLQGPLKINQLVKVGLNSYIRLHTTIPLPAETMVACNDFFVTHPYYYYPAGSAKMEVASWVLGDGLWNFGLAPIFGNITKPFTFLDQRHAYLNDKLYMQMDLTYRVVGTSDSNNGFEIPILQHHWSQDLFQSNLKYVTLGSYSSTQFQLIEDKDTEINKLITSLDKHDEEIVADNPVTRVEDSSPLLNKKVNVPPIPGDDSIIDADTLKGKKNPENQGGGKKKKTAFIPTKEATEFDDLGTKEV